MVLELLSVVGGGCPAIDCLLDMLVMLIGPGELGRGRAEDLGDV